MHKGPRIFGRIAMLLVVLTFELPITQAATFWNETFEGNLIPNWDVSGCGNPTSFPIGCNPVTSTDVAVNGSRSLKGIYNHVGGGTWMDRRFASTDEIYWRVWERFSSDWGWDPAEQVKGFNLGDNATYPNFWVMHAFGSSQLTVQAQVPAEACGSNPSGNGQPYDNCRYDDTAPTPEANGQWRCLEGHIKLNTPGVADGSIERWIDGNLISSFSGRMFRGPSASGLNGNSSNMTFNFIRVYVQAQAAVGSKYYDDLAVGNTRIGCNGSLSNDITPPATPTGLTLQ